MSAYSITTKSGATVRNHTELLDAMDDLRAWGPGFQVRRCVDNAILAVRSGPMGGTRKQVVKAAELENGGHPGDVGEWGDRGPRA